jgi:hypothetical protein
VSVEPSGLDSPQQRAARRLEPEKSQLFLNFALMAHTFCQSFTIASSSYLSTRLEATSSQDEDTTSAEDTVSLHPAAGR